jgi:DNA helicase HerA-like ATPase
MYTPSTTAIGSRAVGQKIGAIVSVKGSRASVELERDAFTSGGRATVGSFLCIDIVATSLVGMITAVDKRISPESPTGSSATATIDLLGEIRQDVEGISTFQRGVSQYPTIGDSVSILPSDMIRLVFGLSKGRSISIGNLYHDRRTEALVDVDSLVARHFAILGSTGVGKSSGVAVLLNEILSIRKDMRIFMLDGHNEYSRCFGELANVLDPRAFKLPFWLFSFEEIVDVIFGGRPSVEEEQEILAELIPIAKSHYLQYKATERLTMKRADPRSTGFTVDTPVPYLLQDLIALIDDRMGKLENRSFRMNYHRLMGRIETIRNDPRYDFMFENANVGGDTMADLLNQLFRIDSAGKPITVMQLAGLPVEVIDAVVSVLCRLAFDFGMWSNGAVPLLFVCEEAHRYASVDQSVGFGPTKRALARIAREGRKYGVSLGLISQRPTELDPTILSQCATIFAMRMSNDRDQALLRSALSDDSADLLSFLPTLGTREVIGFGEGLPLPTRMTFKLLPDHLLPRGNAAEDWSSASGSRPTIEFIQDIVDRWRRASSDRKPRAEEPLLPAEAPTELPQASPLSASGRLDQAKYQLLRR